MTTQTPNVWQTARPRQSQSVTRSGNASPQPSTTSQPSRQHRTQPGNNVWAQRTSQSSEKVGQNGGNQANNMDQAYVPSNGFNSNEVKAFLARESQVIPAVYKLVDTSNTKGSGGPGKATHMANGQPFFAMLARQVSSLENGG